MKKKFFAGMIAALLATTTVVPTMAEETSSEVETAVEMESTEEGSESADTNDRISEIEKLIQSLEKQIAELKTELKTLRGTTATEVGDIIYQDDSVIITYNGVEENEYGNGYDIKFITENLTDKKLMIAYEDSSLNGFMFYSSYYASVAANKKSKDAIEMYDGMDEYCPMDELESLEFCIEVSDGDTYDEIIYSDPIIINFNTTE